MNSELFKSAVATVFRRKGKTLLTEEEFLYTVSMELRWFKPNTEARKFLENARLLDLLRERDGYLHPSFSLDDREIKPVINPPLELAQETTDIVSIVVSMLSSKLGLPGNEVLAQINRLKKEKNIETQAAAIELGLKHGLDVTMLASKALSEITRGYARPT